MASGSYEYQSDFARRYFGQGKAEGIAEGKAEGIAEGKAEGIAEGKAEGKAEAVLAVLASRGIPVPDEIRVCITTCTDLPLLDQWLARAVTAGVAADVVGE